jgi:hypothetical protein
MVLALTVVGACAESDTAIEASTATTTTALRETPMSTTAAITTTSTTTSTPVTKPPSHDFVEIRGPADGQWFNALPIPWVFGTDERGDCVAGASGWTTGEALVTVNGWTADGFPGQIPSERGPGWAWHAPDLDQVDTGWTTGENDVVFEATFGDGTVATSTRTIYFDPTLIESTGWLVDLDREALTLTVAFAPYGTLDPQAGPWAGFLSEPTSVATLPLADDAAFVLLEPHSGGWPPPRALDYDEFISIIDRAEAGDCDDCWTPQCDNPCYFTAGPYRHSFFSPPDEFGDAFILLLTRHDRIQQIEQILGE